jgi:hypothetical protein
VRQLDDSLLILSLKTKFQGLDIVHGQNSLGQTQRPLLYRLQHQKNFWSNLKKMAKNIVFAQKYDEIRRLGGTTILFTEYKYFLKILLSIFQLCASLHCGSS